MIWFIFLIILDLITIILLLKKANEKFILISIIITIGFGLMLLIPLIDYEKPELNYLKESIKISNLHQDYENLFPLQTKEEKEKNNFYLLIKEKEENRNSLIKNYNEILEKCNICKKYYLFEINYYNYDEYNYIK
jgi:hypothetical protein